MPQTMAASSQITPQQQNILARQTVIRQAVDMILPIFTQTYTSANNQGPGLTINVPLRNVGLIKRLVIEVTGNITAAAGSTLTRTAFGGSNFFSNITFTDLSNQTRVNTTGTHLIAVASAKRRRPYGAAVALDPASIGAGLGPAIGEGNAYGYGNTTGATYLPYQVSAGTGTPMQLFFEVPFSYTDHDLRGAIYGNVTNATMNIQLTVNPNLFTLGSARNVQTGMYSYATTAPTLVNYTITIYQNFLDQLPIGQQGGPVLPLLDLSTAYLLNNTAVSGVVVNQDNPIPFANFRDFMSTIVIYNDPFEFTVGEGVNFISLQSANYTNIFKVDPVMNYLQSRLIIGDDFPAAMFYQDYRNKPVSTIQYGNMQLIFNVNTVTDNQTAFFVGFEALALINMITQAGSLYGS